MSRNKRLLVESLDLLVRFKAHRGDVSQATYFTLFSHLLLWEDFANMFSVDISSNEKYSWVARLCSEPRLLFSWNQKLEGFDSQLIRSKDENELTFNFVYAIEHCGLPHCNIVGKRLKAFLDLVPFYMASLLRFGRTILLFSSRIRDPRPEDDLSSWLACEEAIPTHLPAWVADCDVLTRFRENTRYTRFSMDGVSPSSGAVSDMVGLRGKPLGKLAATCTASRKDYKDLAKLDLLPPSIVYYSTRRQLGTPCSKLLFVPKNYKKNRTICAEPAVQAWMQRAIEKTMVRDVREATQGRTDPHKCERNRTLVRSRQLSTIDLSAASDSVSSAFLEYLGPVYHRALRSTRSEICLLPNGSQHTLKKAASMGNGWTFPLECLVFSALAEEACKREGLAPIYSVFGDDIIIPNGAYETCCSLLQECGFTVNQSKSFSAESLFRESCGRDYLWVNNKPIEVTPTRISRSLSANIIDLVLESRDCGELIPLANSSFGTILGKFLTQVLVRSGAHIYCDFVISIDEKSHRPVFSHLFHPLGEHPWDGCPTGFEMTPKRYRIGDADRYPLALKQTYEFSLEYPEGKPKYPELRRVT